MANTGNCEVDNTSGQATRIHQLTSQNEERDSQQRECICACNHVLRDDLRIEHVHVPHKSDTTEHKRESDRNADGHSADERSNEYEKSHQARSESCSMLICSPANAEISSSVMRPVKIRNNLSSEIRKMPAPVNNPMP